MIEKNVLFVYLRSNDLIKKLSDGKFGTRIKKIEKCFIDIIMVLT
jgi:hypothetical protein